MHGLLGTEMSHGSRSGGLESCHQLLLGFLLQGAAIRMGQLVLPWGTGRS